MCKLLKYIPKTQKLKDEKLGDDIEIKHDFLREFEKNYQYCDKREDISKENTEILKIVKEKRLIKQSIESFIANQKNSPYFLKKNEICGFLKHVSFGDIHRDFFKFLKTNTPTVEGKFDAKLTFLKKISKKSVNLIPDDISDIEYSLKFYEENGLCFEKQEK